MIGLRARESDETMSYTLYTPQGVAYATVQTAADVVRRQSRGLGSDADVAAVAAAEHGPVTSTAAFQCGTAAGRPVAVYRFSRDGETTA